MVEWCLRGAACVFISENFVCVLCDRLKIMTFTEAAKQIHDEMYPRQTPHHEFVFLSCFAFA